MSSLKVLERKVDLLIDYIMAPENAYGLKVAILRELGSLRNTVPVISEPKEKTVTSVTESLLTEMGMPTRLKGYVYTVSAIEMLSLNPGLMNMVVKGLYPKVTERVNNIPDCTPSRVERSIRHAIEVTWDRGNPDVLEKYFGHTISRSKGKPTNAEFLCRVYQLVNREVKA